MIMCSNFTPGQKKYITAALLNYMILKHTSSRSGTRNRLWGCETSSVSAAAAAMHANLLIASPMSSSHVDVPRNMSFPLFPARCLKKEDSHDFFWRLTIRFPWIIAALWKRCLVRRWTGRVCGCKLGTTILMAGAQPWKGLLLQTTSKNYCLLQSPATLGWSDFNEFPLALRSCALDV